MKMKRRVAFLIAMTAGLVLMFPSLSASAQKSGATEIRLIESQAPLSIQSRHAQGMKVKGIYVSGWVAGSRMPQYIQMVKKAGLNAMVIDIKNDYGRLTFDTRNPYIKQIGADSDPLIHNMHSVIQSLRSNHIYSIGRLVTFKDPLLAKVQPAWALQKRTGGVWRDSRRQAWMNPYNRNVWNYNIQIAKEAARLGFDEIQFDYVRFPDNGQKVDREVNYQNRLNLGKAHVIRQFLHEAKKELKPFGVMVSADVFGLTTTTPTDMGIGQQWTKISSEVDVISPMIYPSHYGSGWYGAAYPDLAPYTVISHALADGLAKNAQLRRIGIPAAAVRPWLQSFTATWISPHRTYGWKEVALQIRAAKEQGVEQYLLWNPGCSYALR